MRLYRALCTWLEVHAALMVAQLADDSEPQREGAGGAQVEHAPDHRQHELNANDRPDYWYGDDRARRAGF